MNYCIAIDGPAGAGKSTIAKLVSRKLKFVYVDTGAMYRAMGLYFSENNLDCEKQEDIESACTHADITIQYKDGEQLVILNGENVNGRIRTESASMMASKVAKIKEVRVKLVELQRKLAKEENVIMDGRDVGTQILPDADLKIYLTASSMERAKRRWKENVEKGIECDLETIEADIVARDEQDMNREISPLVQAEDAILLDSSTMTIDQVVEEIIHLYNTHK